MSADRTVVVKLGGSLMSGADLGSLLDAVGASHRPAVIVCGGGLFGDAVRVAQGRLGFSDPLAHRLALDSMSHFAEVLGELRPGLPVCSAREDLEAHLAAGRRPIWHPASIRGGHPDIPETWAVTSDSLALFVAREIAAAAVILVKSAEPETGHGLLDLVERGYLDAAFPAFLARYSGIVRILGPADHARLAAAIDEPAVDFGTRIRRPDRGSRE